MGKFVKILGTVECYIEGRTSRHWTGVETGYISLRALIRLPHPGAEVHRHTSIAIRANLTDE